MTLSFDIIAGNNANWGFDAFSLDPELLSVPTPVAAGADNSSLRKSVEGLWGTATTAASMLPPAEAAMSSRGLSASQQSIAGLNFTASENEDNISPMKNEALCVPMQASDPAARAIDSNLYVASLPEWFTDADLYELFRRFGPILSAKVMCHKGTHHCKGYGFVLFQRTDDAAAARSEMIGHVVGGNKIQVRRARSAASAPLGECGSTLFAETPQHLRGGGCSDGVSKLSLSFQQPQPQQQQLSNTSALNASPQFTAATCCAPQPFHSMYSNMPAYVMSGSRNSSGHSGVMNSHANPSRSSAQTMFVAIPNGRNVAQGPDNVVYMVLTSPHMQPSNVIF